MSELKQYYVYSYWHTVMTKLSAHASIKVAVLDSQNPLDIPASMIRFIVVSADTREEALAEGAKAFRMDTGFLVDEERPIWRDYVQLGPSSFAEERLEQPLQDVRHVESRASNKASDVDKDDDFGFNEVMK